jgi:predicted thioredoxin/glutaredoxin
MWQTLFLNRYIKKAYALLILYLHNSVQPFLKEKIMSMIIMNLACFHLSQAQKLGKRNVTDKKSLLELGKP